jgi:hypothetical protein
MAVTAKAPSKGLSLRVKNDGSTSITMKVSSFRHLETPPPLLKAGYRDYYAYVLDTDLPDLKEWRKVNVRDSKLVGFVPNKIRDGFNNPLFPINNRGLSIAVKTVRFDNATNMLTLIMDDPEKHGLLDGGHTYEIVMAERGNGVEQWVKIEIVEGLDDQDELTDLVEARNTSNQVREQSIMELGNKFEGIKPYLETAGLLDKVAFKEYDLDVNGSPKPIDIRDIVALLTAFDIEHYSSESRKHPVIAYSSKTSCLSRLNASMEASIDDKGSEKAMKAFKAFESLYPLVGDIMALHDQIYLTYPDHYDEFRKKDGKQFGSFGKVTGIVGSSDVPDKVTLEYTGHKSPYKIPSAFIYPVLSAFRAYIEKGPDGRYQWTDNVFELAAGQLGEDLVADVFKYALKEANPNKVGKEPLVWDACFKTARLTKAGL